MQKAQAERRDPLAALQTTEQLVYKDSQSLTLVERLTYQDDSGTRVSLRLTIRSDSYTDQSYAKLEAFEFKRLRWNDVETIEGAAMMTRNGIHHVSEADVRDAEARTRACVPMFAADRIAILRRCAALLSLGGIQKR